MSELIPTSPVELFGFEMTSLMLQLKSQSGFDALRDPSFWESWLTVQLGGVQTEHKGDVDVAVEIWGRRCTAEIKFSRAFYCQFTPIRGRDWSRNMFKWVITVPQEARRKADAVILVGVDLDDAIYTWVVPYSSIPAGRRAISATAPSSRMPGTSGRLDAHSVPATEVLHAFARQSHVDPQIDLEDWINGSA